MPAAPNYFAHASAIVDPGAAIGDGTKVWHFSHVSAGARIGRDCVLGQNVYVAPSAVIGDGVKIQNNVSVYDAVTLEDDVFCGPSMVFTNVYNPRAAAHQRAAVLVLAHDGGATLGANSTLVCGITVGRHAFVGAGAVVQKDVPDFALVVGVPARQIGWMSRHGERLPLPVQGEGEATCPHSGDRYRLEGRTLTLVA